MGTTPYEGSLEVRGLFPHSIEVTSVPGGDRCERLVVDVAAAGPNGEPAGPTGVT